MGGQLKLSLVAPEDVWLGLDSGLREHVVQVGDLVEASITDYDEKRPVVQFDAVFDQDFDPLINLLFHFSRVKRSV